MTYIRNELIFEICKDVFHFPVIRDTNMMRFLRVVLVGVVSNLYSMLGSRELKTSPKTTITASFNVFTIEMSPSSSITSGGARRM